MVCDNLRLNQYLKIKKFFKCPPQKYLSKFLTILFCLVFIYICLYFFDHKSATPRNSIKRNRNVSSTALYNDGNFFGLFILFCSSIIAGKIYQLMKLPPFIGMLTMGFILRSFPDLNVIYIDKFWNGYLRSIALTVFFIRFGLDIDSKFLEKKRFVIARLACTPCLFEAAVGGAVSHYLLNLPWGWSYIFGFLLSATSPSIAVPRILELQKKNIGVDKGVNTLVNDASYIDNVLAITGFGIALRVTFLKNENLILKIFRGPIEAMTGVSYGVIFGIMMWYLPSNDNDKFMFYRIVALYVSAMAAMLGSTTFQVPGAGLLAVLTLSFVASKRWKKDPMWKNHENPVIKTTEMFWWLLQPLLFGLVGAGVDIGSVNASVLGYGILTILIGLLVRLLVTLVVLFGTDFDMKEKLFVAIAWLPKAMIQAAVGPMALDLAIKEGRSNEFVKYGRLVLAVAVMSILITAPLGAALVSMTGPLLLKKCPVEVDREFGDVKYHIAAPESGRLYSEEDVD